MVMHTSRIHIPFRLIKLESSKLKDGIFLTLLFIGLSSIQSTVFAVSPTSYSAVAVFAPSLNAVASTRGAAVADVCTQWNSNGSVCPSLYTPDSEGELVQDQKDGVFACVRDALPCAGPGSEQALLITSSATCPAGFDTQSSINSNSSEITCTQNGSLPLKNAGKPPPESCPNLVSNPINIGTGNKYQREIDYSGPYNYSLRFERFYNSIEGTQPGSLGSQWRTIFDRSILMDGSGTIATAYRQDGVAFSFYLVGGNWVADPDVRDRLTAIQNGWEYTTSDDTVEYYNSNGRLDSFKLLGGFIFNLSYDQNNKLTTVTDPFGRALTFSYDIADRLSTMQDPELNVYTYAYDLNGNLSSVTRPDTTIRT